VFLYSETPRDYSVSVYEFLGAAATAGNPQPSSVWLFFSLFICVHFSWVSLYVYDGRAAGGKSAKNEQIWTEKTRENSVAGL